MIKAKEIKMKNPWIEEEKKDTYEIRGLEISPCYKMDLVGHVETTDTKWTDLTDVHWVIPKGHVWLIDACMVAKSDIHAAVWKITASVTRDQKGISQTSSHSTSFARVVPTFGSLECPCICTPKDGKIIFRVRGIDDQTIKWVARINVTGVY